MIITFEVTNDFLNKDNNAREVHLTVDKEGGEYLAGLLSGGKWEGRNRLVHVPLFTDEWDIGDITSQKFIENTTTPHILHLRFVD